MPDITLVVPMFNRPRTLEKILKALDLQTLPANRFETIFVDDSGPESYHVQRDIIAKNPPKCRHSYLTTGCPREVNALTVARNLGIKAAKSPIMVFMDDDCVPNPYLLESYVAAHKETDHLMAVGNRSEEDSILTARPPIPVTRGKCVKEHAASLKGTLGAGDFIGANCSALKKDFVKAGLYDESFAQAGEYGYEDRDMGTRMLAIGCTIRFVQNAACWIAPKESDPWAGHLEEAKEAAHRRYREKHPRTLLRKAVRWLKKGKKS